MAIQQKTLDTHATAMVGAFNAAIAGGEEMVKRGAALREQAAWALDKLGEPEGLAFIAVCTAKAQEGYIAKFPRPAGASDSKESTQWRNRFRNAYRAVKTELDERKTSGVVKISWKAEAEGATVEKRKESKSVTKTPLKTAIAAIEKLESATQGDCDTLVAAVVAHFGIKRVNKAVS